ncbi:MAG: trypsin-like serine protease [Methanomicrobiales archaeon]|nr:trypsin-like serine protease [Methanomicrobiales archaeon]
MKIGVILIFFCIFTVLLCINTGFADDNIGKIEQALSQGSPVPEGELEAVGTVGGCSATLITDNLVLAAGHCFCDDFGNNCGNRAQFILHDVRPVNNPNIRQDISISGDVRIHPEYGKRGWLREDYSVIELDQPASSVALVNPISVENPWNIPLVGEKLTLVGFGATGTDCKSPSKGKMKMEVAVDGSGWGGISFKNAQLHSCPGDSGGPIINKAGHVVGVASWNQGSSSTYRPTSYAYNWIYGIPTPGWSDCSWIPIETGGINSHGKSQYCPEGSYLTALDLDGDRSLSDMDTPVIGQAKCCKIKGAKSHKWEKSEWFQIETKGISSHSMLGSWCPQGSYITGIDLDAAAGSDPMDSPVIGQVQCSKPTGYDTWGSTYWMDVGPDLSHQKNDWCLDGAFITQLDLDRVAGDDPHDSPVVGKAKCSCAREQATPTPTPATVPKDFKATILPFPAYEPVYPVINEGIIKEAEPVDMNEIAIIEPAVINVTGNYEPEENINLPGLDYSSFDLSSDDPLLCVQACEQDSQCVACTYVKPGVQGTSARCWLKNGVPEKQTDQCCSSWVKP